MFWRKRRLRRRRTLVLPRCPANLQGRESTTRLVAEAVARLSVQKKWPKPPITHLTVEEPQLLTQHKLLDNPAQPLGTLLPSTAIPATMHMKLAMGTHLHQVHMLCNTVGILLGFLPHSWTRQLHQLLREQLTTQPFSGSR